MHNFLVISSLKKFGWFYNIIKSPVCLWMCCSGSVLKLNCWALIHQNWQKILSCISKDKVNLESTAIKRWGTHTPDATHWWREDRAYPYCRALPSVFYSTSKIRIHINKRMISPFSLKIFFWWLQIWTRNQILWLHNRRMGRNTQSHQEQYCKYYRWHGQALQAA